MNTMYILAGCSTCSATMKQIEAKKNGFLIIDIKALKLTGVQLDEMRNLAGSYERLFSKRAVKFRESGMAEKTLSEQDYRQLILSEYTFLRRPVSIVNQEIFIGSDRSTIENLMLALRK